MDSVIYRRIFPKLIEPIFILSPDNTVWEANESMEILLGYDIGEMKGKDVGSMFVEEPDEELASVLDNEEKELQGVGIEFRRNDGTSIVREVNVFPIEDEDEDEDDEGAGKERVLCFQILAPPEKYLWLGDIFDVSDRKYSYGGGPIPDPSKTRIAEEIFAETVGLEPAGVEREEEMSEALVPAPNPPEYEQLAFPLPNLLKDGWKIMGGREDGDGRGGIQVITKEGMVVIDEEGKVVDHNEIFLKLVGKESGEVLDAKLEEVLETKEANATGEILAALRKDGTVVDREITIKTESEEELGICVDGTSISSGEGKIGGFVLFLKVAGKGTEEKGAGDWDRILGEGAKIPFLPSSHLISHCILRYVADLVDDGIVITDGSGGIIHANSAVAELSGKDLSVLRGKDIGLLFTSDSRGEISDILEGGSVNDPELTIVRMKTEGEAIEVSLVSSRIKEDNGRTAGVMWRIEREENAGTEETGTEETGTEDEGTASRNDHGGDAGDGGDGKDGKESKN